MRPQILTLTKKGMISMTTANSIRWSDTGDSLKVDNTATTGGNRKSSASMDLAKVASAAYNTHWHSQAAHIGGLPERVVTTSTVIKL